MESTNQTIKQVLDELFTLLETMETQSLAILQFLKDQKISTDENLAPYMDQASNAASVKWRAARARMEYLFSATDNKPAVSGASEEKTESKKSEKNETGKDQPQKAEAETEGPSSEEKTAAKTPKPADATPDETQKTETSSGGEKKAVTETKKVEQHQAPSTDIKNETGVSRDPKPAVPQEGATEKPESKKPAPSKTKLQTAKNDESENENAVAQKRSAKQG